MEKTDFRTLPKEAREAIKIEVLKQVKNGMTCSMAAKLYGIRIGTVCKWVKEAKFNNGKALQERKRGRKSGEKRTLTEEQEKQLQKWLIDKHPEQLKLPFALWTRDAVKDLIKLQFKIDMPIRTVGEYLKRWGFTPKKPVKQAYEQQPETVKKWLDEEYPEIKKQAKKENAEILWGDETGISSESNTCRGYSPKGEKSVVRTSGKRFSISMISAITNEGLMRYMIYKGALVIKTFLSFLWRLIYKAKRKIYLIVDNLKVHHAKAVMKWIEKHSDIIAIFYLPPYAPEHNPDEYVNQDLKSALSRKPKPRSEQALKTNLRSHMITVQKKPEKVMSFFNHQKVVYAK